MYLFPNQYGTWKKIVVRDGDRVEAGIGRTGKRFLVTGVHNLL